MGILHRFDRRNQQRVDAVRRASQESAPADRGVTTPDGGRLSVRLRVAHESYLTGDEGTLLAWTAGSLAALARGLRPTPSTFKIGVLVVESRRQREDTSVLAGRWARPRLVYEERGLDRDEALRRVDELCPWLRTGGLDSLVERDRA